MSLATSPSLLCSDFSSLPPPRPSPSHDSTTSYTNTIQAFSQDTGYDTSNLLGRQSGLISQARNSSKSSRQIEAFGNKFLSAISENVSVPAAVAATATSLSRKSSLHARARSLASYVPSLNSSLPEDAQTTSPPQQTRGFSGLFRATSIRRSSVAPREEDEDADEEDESEHIMDYKPTLTGGPDSTPRLPSSTTTSNSTPQAPSRRFSWFSNTTTTTATPSNLTLSSADSSLLANPTTLLFPHGAPSPTSPTAYADLLATSLSQITRLQSAYKSSTTALVAATADLAVRAEEAEESATRAAHLKLQLEAMAARAAEQDAAMRLLATELAAEKQRRVEVEESVSSMRRGRDRRSAGGSDSGFESDFDGAESASGRSCGSGSRPLTPVSSYGWSSSSAADGKRGGVIEVRPMSSGSGRGGRSTCEVDAGVWMFMREEKGRLERRVKELEGVVESALDLVGGR